MNRFVLKSAAAASVAVTVLAFAALAQETDEPWSQADAYFDPAEMKAARDDLLAHHGGQNVWYFQADRFEVRSTDDADLALLDGNAWYGGDINKAWLKVEAEYDFDASEFEEAEAQLLWSHAISPYFDVQTGIRQDFKPEGRTHAVLGLQGLAPYLFEVDGAAFLSTEGDLTARMEAEYELLLMQRLILQPRVEVDISAQDIPELETGSGLTSASAGLRLRYEIIREFAPYVGVEWTSSFGGTADYLKAAGEDTDETAFVFGIRAWF